MGQRGTRLAKTEEENRISGDLGVQMLTLGGTLLRG